MVSREVHCSASARSTWVPIPFVFLAHHASRELTIRFPTLLVLTESQSRTRYFVLIRAPFLWALRQRILDFCRLATGKLDCLAPPTITLFLEPMLTKFAGPSNRRCGSVPSNVALMVADFFAFNAHYRDNDRFDPARLAAATRQAWPGFLGSDFFAFSLGSDALGLSWTTVLASWRRRSLNTAPRAAEHGDSWLTHFRNCERSYLDKWFPKPARTYEFSCPQTGCDRLADFDAALRVCTDRGIRLIVICPPIHARFQEALAAAGAWPIYEEWKRQIALRTRLRQTPVTGYGVVELWDFSLFNEITCEALPAEGTRPMRYFSDSAHFTPDFGHIILDEVLKGTPRLGVRLDQTDIEGHLSGLRAELQRFRIANPGVVADVRAALGIAKGSASPLKASALEF